jgi:alkylmercury lyase
VRDKRISPEQLSELTALLGDENILEAMGFLSAVLNLLARGRSVPPAEIAKALRVSQQEAESALRKFGAEVDDEGNLVGFALTLNQTPHRVGLEGVDRPFYAWCAVDAILFGPFLNRSIRIESSDPLTGERIMLVTTPDGVENVQPGSVVVSWRPPRREFLADIRGDICQYLHLFGSYESAQRWLSQRLPDALILSPQDVNQIGRALKRQLDTELPGQDE